MIILYNLFIFFFNLTSRIAALFNPKARAFVSGRKNMFDRLAAAIHQNKGPVIWIHCASLGEFEQGRPVIEKLKSEFPQYKVLLTFFSPSGYEVQKGYDKADYVFYMPLDTPGNAWKFVSIARPSLAIFVKYEFWYHHCMALRNQSVPILSISSIFRPDQLFFKSYGDFFREILHTFSHFFVQNEESIQLLRSIDLSQCTRVGDTRFDRVYQIVMQGQEIPLAATFKGTDNVFVIGSCWADDMDVLIPFINMHGQDFKFIIAPHEIKEDFIKEIEGALSFKSIRFSQAKDNDLSDARILIIDNVGMLSRLYRYGEYAFIGGAYGKGLHNILEAACYGVPIFFGNKNYQKYQEATELIKYGGAFDVADYPDLKKKFDRVNTPQNFQLAREVTRQYVKENLGAADKIMQYCRRIL